ncbi:hypothetical protein BU15DRAFT_66107 [Melanogaster broomeanus]|nr:hypothetical protein BU15DRAFT_66107 [Melanogaster broomeanus]
MQLLERSTTTEDPKQRGRRSGQRGKASWAFCPGSHWQLKLLPFARLGAGCGSVAVDGTRDGFVAADLLQIVSAMSAVPALSLAFCAIWVGCTARGYIVIQTHERSPAASNTITMTPVYARLSGSLKRGSALSDNEATKEIEKHDARESKNE